MDVTCINPFLAATRDVFETMVRLPFKIGKAYLKRPGERLYKLYRIAASVGISGSGTGLCVLNLSEPAALALAAGLTGVPAATLDAECLDALDRIANMIAGGARKRLAGGLIEVSKPVVVRTHQVVYPPGIPVIGIPADTGAGRFILEVAFRPHLAAPLVAKPAAEGAPAVSAVSAA